jgi:two-component system, response regulator, stage 0 sporulation protein F
MTEAVTQTTAKTVLVVDDEEDVRRLFLQRFRREIRNGLAEFVFAGSGAEALKALNELDASAVLILSDIRMEGMDGFDLLKAIGERWPKLHVYLVTAYDSDEYRDRALQMGAEGYLTKPVDFTELRQLILG